MTPIVGYMCAHNGAEFIEYAIRSTIDYVDKFVIIEGAWQTNIKANRQPRSVDGTIDILDMLKNEYGNKVEVYPHNDVNQIQQRSRIFEYITHPCWVWLIDHDEVYDKYNAEKIRNICQNNYPADCIKINSLTFFNDTKHYAPIAFNRLFKIIKNPKLYRMHGANHIIYPYQNKMTNMSKDIYYFHYSYLHTQERFLQKRRERILVHGKFKWEIDQDGKVFTPNGRSFKIFEGEHPEIMKEHILWQK